MIDGLVSIAHLSDLHFGADGYKDVSLSLARHLGKEKPDLVLVTGDLVDTPDDKLFDEAYEWLEGLNTVLGWKAGEPRRYLVCAGNHDRHGSGNARPWKKPKYKFEKRFSAPSSFVQWLGQKPYRWRVRVISVDSSIRARYSAQAFLGQNELEPIRDLKEWSDPEEAPFLVLMLIHHHLLPLPACEAGVQTLWDLFKFTSAVNPGTILENLAGGYVDAVLHGHEHKRNLARYGSYRKDTNQIVITAAASATGMETLKGCDIARASFNVLKLHPDRSVWIEEVHGPGGNYNDWHAEPQMPLLDSTTLRHNRFLRALHLWRKEHNVLGRVGDHSEWRKHVTLTARRDGVVREHRTNWQITDGEFSFRIQNDTGQPARPHAELELVDPVAEPRLLGFSPLRGDRGAYAFRVDAGTKAPVEAALIKTSYQWLDAVVLTEDDLELIDMNQTGPFRGSGQEFVAATVTTPLRELTLSVTFPVGFYPSEKQVGVYHERLPVSGPPIEDKALNARLQFTGQTILLTIPYPLLGYRYAIAWTPVAAQPPSPWAKDFQDRCRRAGLGDRLAASFISGLEAADWGKHCSVALYVPDMPEPGGGARNRFLRRTGFARGGAIVPEVLEPPPMQIDLREGRGLYLHAWWGETAIVVCSPDELDDRARKEGVRAGEFVAATIPFLEPAHSDESPWGIVRVGVLAAVPELTNSGGIEALRSRLARGYVNMLASFHQLLEVGK
jgi:hypothetical protein